MYNKSNIKAKTLIVMLFTFTFVTVLWILQSSNSLTMDDFSTISLARFNDYSELFRILPAQSYNDRSIGLIFIKLLNDMFGDNYKMYHYVFVLVHLLNVGMVFKIGLNIFGDDKNNYIYAIIGAAIFGIYPVSLMSVSWISAVYDLVCCMFVLLGILFYIKAKKSKEYKTFYGILSILFYYLSLRSKEMGLVIPIILLMFEVAIGLKNKINIRLPWYLTVKIIIMFGYSGILFSGGMVDIPIDNPYYQSFNPFHLLRNAIRYLILYCDLGNSTFNYVGLTKYGIPVLIILVGIIIFSIFNMVKNKEFSLFLSILCAAGSLTVVLPMFNLQHRLYLYIPSIFIGIACAIFFRDVVNVFKIKYVWEVGFIIIPVLYLLSYTPGTINFKQYWTTFCKQDAYTINEIKRIEPLVPETNIYIKGASEGYSTFFYGPGNSIKLMFDDNTLKPVLVDEFPQNPEVPYVFWEYSNGNVIEKQRDSTQIIQDNTLVITSVYPNEINRDDKLINENGTIFISVTCNKITPELTISVNGITLPTTIGEEFISTVVPKEMLEGAQLEVYVNDSTHEKKSDTINIPIH